MYTLNPIVLQRCLSYHELFGKKLPDKEIIAYVQSLDMYNSISIICELLTLRDKNIKKKSSYLCWDIDLTIPFDSVLKNLLLEYCDNHKIELTEEAKSLLNPMSKEAKLITLQSLLHALKILLAYGKYEWNYTNPLIEKEEYSKIIILSLISTDLLSVDDLRPDHFIYGNYQLNQFNNVGSEICRAYYMYCSLGASPVFLPEGWRGHWININADFLSKYGYSISQYLATVFLLVEKELSDQDRLFFHPIYLNMDTAFSKTNHPECSKAVIADLSVNAQDLQPWAKETLRSWWDYSEFLEHPILCAPMGKCISLCDKTIVNSLYANLYWRLRNCYLQSDTTIMSYIGGLYEKYLQEITEKAVENVKEDYTYVSEFFYHTADTDNNASSDAYIIHGKQMIAIEAKSYFPLFQSITKTDDTKIKQSIERLFIIPVLQADKANSALSIACPQFFEGIEEVFIISVTAQGLGAVPTFYNIALQEISTQTSFSKHKYSINFGIGEYEYFLSMMENRIDVFSILESYCSQTSLQPFISFAQEKSGHSSQRTKHMESLFHTCMQELHDVLFPQDDT